MNIFKAFQNTKIKNLEAEVARLQLYKKIYESRYDNWIRRIVHTFSPEQLMTYLKLRAKLNLQLSKHVGIYYENSTPSILEEESIELMQTVSEYKRRYEADLEAAGLFLREVEDGETKRLHLR